MLVVLFYRITALQPSTAFWEAQRGMLWSTSHTGSSSLRRRTWLRGVRRALQFLGVVPAARYRGQSARRFAKAEPLAFRYAHEAGLVAKTIGARSGCGRRSSCAERIVKLTVKAMLACTSPRGWSKVTPTPPASVTRGSARAAIIMSSDQFAEPCQSMSVAFHSEPRV